MEQALLGSQADAQAALKRLRALAFELRVPMTAVRLKLETLKLTAPSEQQESVESIERNCARMCDLVDQLGSELEALQPRPA